MIGSTIISFANLTAPEDSYWLTIEPEIFDDRATVADAALAADTLYDLDPCFEVQEQQEEEPEQEDLQRVAAALDLDLCKALLSGDYEAEVKIIRSHPELPYSLILSAGGVKQTIRHDEPLIITLDIKEASSVVLPSPVVSGLAASWFGNVYGKKGAVPPPVINAKHNTLFWAGTVTGTLRVQFNSTWEILTVAVPGVKEHPEDRAGEKQSSDILAFYHYQTYTESISPPPDDPSVDDQFLAEICGWGSGSRWAPEDEDPPIEEPPVPEDPCLWHFDDLGSYRPIHPEYYADKCCRSWPFSYPIPDCKELVVGHVPTKEPDQATVERYLAWHNGPVEFIAVGPDPDNQHGCGRIINEIVIAPHNCCDEVVDTIAWNDDLSPDVMADNSAAWIGVTGGLGPWQFRAMSPGIYFKTAGGSHVQTIDSGWPTITLYSGDICGVVDVLVTDQCGSVTGRIRATEGHWEEVFDSNYIGGSVEQTSYVLWREYAAWAISGREGPVPGSCHTSVYCDYYRSEWSELAKGSYKVRRESVVATFATTQATAYTFSPLHPGCNSYQPEGRQCSYSEQYVSLPPAGAIPPPSAIEEYWDGGCYSYCGGGHHFPGARYISYEWVC